MTDALEPLVGEWRMEAIFPSGSPAAGLEIAGTARTTFEWMPGRRFLVQRWEVPHPDAPDGLAVIGPDSSGAFVQHYFDSRGVARVYAMGFEGGEWTLSRTEADLSPLDFAQRFTGRLSEDGGEIRGNWELADDGSTWEHDFELVYTRLA